MGKSGSLPRWQLCRGISGSFRVEWVAGFVWNQWQLWSGIRTLFVTGAVIAGMGQGISFRAGMGAIASASPTTEKAAVTSAFFVVAYIAISVPVIGVGLLSAALPLKPVSVGFAALSVAFSFAALLWLRRGAVARP